MLFVRGPPFGWTRTTGKWAELTAESGGQVRGGECPAHSVVGIDVPNAEKTSRFCGPVTTWLGKGTCNWSGVKSDAVLTSTLSCLTNIAALVYLLWFWHHCSPQLEWGTLCKPPTHMWKASPSSGPVAQNANIFVFKLGQLNIPAGSQACAETALAKRALSSPETEGTESAVWAATHVSAHGLIKGNRPDNKRRFSLQKHSGPLLLHIFWWAVLLLIQKYIWGLQERQQTEVVTQALAQIKMMKSGQNCNCYLKALERMQKWMDSWKPAPGGGGGGGSELFRPSTHPGSQNSGAENQMRPHCLGRR